MINRKPLCKGKEDKEDKKYIKTPLCGKLEMECGCTTVLFDGRCFCNSIGKIQFENKGDCTVEIYKNQLSTPISIIPPGSDFYLVSTPLDKIVVKCREICKCNTCSDCCGCNTCSETYNCGTSKGWSTCNYNKCHCDKCILCYKGWVCSKICDDLCKIEDCCNICNE